jgi:hypothetical protein
LDWSSQTWFCICPHFLCFPSLMLFPFLVYLSIALESSSISMSIWIPHRPWVDLSRMFGSGLRAVPNISISNRQLGVPGKPSPDVIQIHLPCICLY